MDIFSFLYKLIQQDESINRSVVWEFRGKEYPILFFSLLNPIARMSSVDRDQFDIQNLYDLEMSFLPVSTRYWLGDILKEEKSRQDFDAYIRSYDGQQKFALFLSSDSKPLEVKSINIELDSPIGLTEYKLLYNFFFPNLSYDESVLRSLFKQNIRVSLDDACQLARYQTLLGKQDPGSIQPWLEYLVAPPHSLFLFSQYFFAKEASFFLKEWRALKVKYPFEFWLTYWLEQIWQALIFLDEFRTSKNLDQARNVTKRLPFSFMQKDYRKTSYQELSRAYQFLYNLDYRSKNGDVEDGLELFYFKFLKGMF
jgi:hypothetical protein